MTKRKKGPAHSPLAEESVCCSVKFSANVGFANDLQTVSELRKSGKSFCQARKGQAEAEERALWEASDRKWDDSGSSRRSAAGQTCRAGVGPVAVVGLQLHGKLIGQTPDSASPRTRGQSTDHRRCPYEAFSWGRGEERAVWASQGTGVKRGTSQPTHHGQDGHPPGRAVKPREFTSCYSEDVRERPVQS